MAERTPIEATNIDGYGAEPFAWQEVRDALAAPKGMEMVCYLGTVRPVGRPHSVGIGPIWFNDDFYFTTGKNTRKMKNLAANPYATISTRVLGFDVTVEGTVSQVDDPELLEQLAAQYRDGGWPAEVAGDAFTAPYSAQTAGPPPWHVYRFRVSQVIALRLSESGGAMRWRFAD